MSSFYSVGMKQPEWKTNDVLVQLHFREPAWELVIGYPGMTKDEMSEIIYGPIQTAFTVIDDALFFLAKTGRIPWMDAPYEPRLGTPLDYSEQYESGTGAPLLVLAVDTASGSLLRMRAVGLGSLQSNLLNRVCMRLLNMQPFDEEEYHQRVESIYRRYPSSEDMLKTVDIASVFFCTSISANPYIQ